MFFSSLSIFNYSRSLVCLEFQSCLVSVSGVVIPCQCFPPVYMYLPSSSCSPPYCHVPRVPLVSQWYSVRTDSQPYLPACSMNCSVELISACSLMNQNWTVHRPCLSVCSLYCGLPIIDLFLPCDHNISLKILYLCYQ